MTGHQSFEQDTSQAEREKEGDTQYSSHQWILWRTKQKKKNSTTTYGGREKCIMIVHGSLLQDAVYWIHLDRAQEKRLQFGRQGLTPLLITIQCRPTAFESWYTREETKLISETLHPSPRSEDSTQRCLEIKAPAAAGAAT